MEKETNNSEYVKITKEDFDYLVKRSWFLNRLDEGGVDNWVGYEFSYDDLKEKLKDSDMSAYELSNRHYYREINTIED